MKKSNTKYYYRTSEHSKISIELDTLKQELSTLEQKIKDLQEKEKIKKDLKGNGLDSRDYVKGLSNSLVQHNC